MGYKAQPATRRARRWHANEVARRETVVRRHSARGRGALLERLKVRVQLALILALPLLAVLALSGVAAYAAVSRIRSADAGLQLVRLSASAGRLVSALQAERTSATRLLQDSRGNGEEVYSRRADESDAAVAAFRHDLVQVPAGETAQAAIRVEAALAQLPLLRVRVQSDARLSLQGVVVRYRLLIADLLQLRQAPMLVGLPGDLADRARAAWALSAAAEQAALVQVTVIAAAGQEWSSAQLSRFVAGQSGYTEALREASSAAPQWRSWWDQTVAGEAVLAMQRLEGAVSRTRLGEALRVDTSAWAGSGDARLGLMNQVVSRADGQLATEVRLDRSRQIRQLVLLTAAVVAGVAAALLVGVLVSRVLSRRLRRLEDDATKVAHHHLPRALSTVAASAIGLDPQTVLRNASESLPLPIVGSDEVAAVGEAMHKVAVEALRLAVGEALVKGGVRQSHMDIARRMQRLLNVVQGRLDELEMREQDTARLNAIFAVDSAVAQIMRFTASLLVLAGGSSELPREEPVELYDVAKAAMSQVEQYPRVEVQIEAGLMVAPMLVDDLVHLLAELIDNATAFSPPESSVVVQAWRSRSGVRVTVEDQGLGVSAQQLAQLNQELAAPTDPVSPRSLGLATVARLAARHGLAVRLTSGHSTVAEVELPAHMLQLSVRQPRANTGQPMLIPRPFDRASNAQRASAPVPARPDVTWPPQPAPVVGHQPPQLSEQPPQTQNITEGGLPIRQPHAKLPRQHTTPPVRVLTPIDPHAAQTAMRNYQRGLTAAGRLPAPRTARATHEPKDI